MSVMRNVCRFFFFGGGGGNLNERNNLPALQSDGSIKKKWISNTRVGTLIVATTYLQLIQNRYMFRSFTVLQCSHQHCVQPVASDVKVVGYL